MFSCYYFPFLGILALDATKLAEQTRLTTPFSGGCLTGTILYGSRWIILWVPLSHELRRVKGVLSKTITTNYMLRLVFPRKTTTRESKHTQRQIDWCWLDLILVELESITDRQKRIVYMGYRGNNTVTTCLKCRKNWRFRDFDFR